MNKKLHKIGGFATALLMATTIFVPANASAQTACAPFVRDLTLGSTGADVIALQTFLESKGTLTIPAGVSKGYFGALTQTALARYQAANAINPAAGYFGPVTRTKVNAACTTTPANPTKPDNGNNLSGGEASLEKFDLSSGDDSDVREGQTADIAEIEFDVEDGDINLDRIDLQLVADSGNDEKDPWDTFKSIQLLVDGKKIASKTIDGKTAYLDKNKGTIRFSNIKHKFDEGDTAKIVVQITAQNSVDGSDTDNAGWSLNVLDDGIRATDAEGIQQYVGDEDDTVSFDVVDKADGEELSVKTSSEDPDSDTFKVEDNKKSSEHEIFAFEIEGEESDIEIDSVTLTLTSDVAVSNVISDLVLEIDGEDFDDWSFVGTGTSTRTVKFDIDGDYTLDADDTVTAVLKAKFKAANGSNYSSGATIKASIADGGIEGEGSDDVQSDGSVVGEEHVLATQGIIIPAKSVNTTTATQGQNDTVGIFTIKFEVTAFEEDFYIAENAATNATNGVKFTVEGPASSTVSATLASTGDEDTNGVFTVKEGETETFTLTVSVDPSQSGQYRVALNSIFATQNPNGTTGVVEKAVKVTEFRTAYKLIND